MIEMKELQNERYLKMMEFKIKKRQMKKHKDKKICL